MIDLKNIVNEKYIGKEENPINQNEIYNLASSINIKNNKTEINDNVCNSRS